MQRIYIKLEYRGIKHNNTNHVLNGKGQQTTPISNALSKNVENSEL